MGFNLWDIMPVIGGIKNLYEAGKDVKNGDWKSAGKDALSAISPTAAEAIGYQDAADEKRSAYDHVQQNIDRIKQERQGMRDFAFNKADAMYDPTKKAIAALYGDPATWKL